MSNSLLWGFAFISASREAALNLNPDSIFREVEAMLSMPDCYYLFLFFAEKELKLFPVSIFFKLIISSSNNDKKSNNNLFFYFHCLPQCHRSRLGLDKEQGMIHLEIGVSDGREFLLPCKFSARETLIGQVWTQEQLKEATRVQIKSLNLSLKKWVKRLKDFFFLLSMLKPLFPSWMGCSLCD